MATSKRFGRQSYRLTGTPRVLAYASTAGKKEGEGPLRESFDTIVSDDTLGEKSWEKAETLMLTATVTKALEKGNISAGDVQVFLGGDLLNQIVSAGFAARGLQIPFLGQYGACSTMAQTLLMGALLLDGGYADTAVCATCSHFSTAERQYRTPLELGSQRPNYAQWTVTGAGATVLTSAQDKPIGIEAVTIGKVVDLGQNNENNMGAAMAPAAADTLCAHMRELGRTVNDYDRIVTGDLGQVGYALFKELCEKSGFPLDERYTDCGCDIYAPEQGLYAGGSGCGCSAVVLNGHLYKMMEQGDVKRLLFLATGAMLSPTTTLQGESIPGIAHAISFEAFPAQEG